MKRCSILLLLSLCLGLLAACAPAKPTLDKTILGTWKNTDGYQIQFKEKGQGFIPGVQGAIPDSSFTYTIVDENHIQISLEGKSYPVQIDIQQDTLIWKDSLGDVTYTRVNP